MGGRTAVSVVMPSSLVAGRAPEPIPLAGRSGSGRPEHRGSIVISDRDARGGRRTGVQCPRTGGGRPRVGRASAPSSLPCVTGVPGGRRRCAAHGSCRSPWHWPCPPAAAPPSPRRAPDRRPSRPAEPSASAGSAVARPFRQSADRARRPRPGRVGGCDEPGAVRPVPGRGAWLGPATARACCWARRRRSASGAPLLLEPEAGGVPDTVAAEVARLGAGDRARGRGGRRPRHGRATTGARRRLRPRRSGGRRGGDRAGVRAAGAGRRRRRGRRRRGARPGPPRRTAPGRRAATHRGRRRHRFRAGVRARRPARRDTLVLAAGGADSVAALGDRARRRRAGDPDRGRRPTRAARPTWWTPSPRPTPETVVALGAGVRRRGGARLEAGDGGHRRPAARRRAGALPGPAARGALRPPRLRRARASWASSRSTRRSNGRGRTPPRTSALVGTTVVPAFEIIATVASSSAGPDGNYSAEADPEVLRPWVEAAGEAGLYVILDLQPGRTDFVTQAERYRSLLELPHVGLALDPEWRLGPGEVHLTQVGSVDVDEVNRVVTWLADLTRENAPAAEAARPAPVPARHDRRAGAAGHLPRRAGGHGARRRSGRPGRQAGDLAGAARAAHRRRWPGGGRTSTTRTCRCSRRSRRSIR